ncbi:MAG TPA: hypothetical protein VNR89_17555 [Roseomonas sp.]|nr:hypothetical protein [Roseomonas sp.]
MNAHRVAADVNAHVIGGLMPLGFAVARAVEQAAEARRQRAEEEERAALMARLQDAYRRIEILQSGLQTANMDLRYALAEKAAAERENAELFDEMLALRAELQTVVPLRR